MTYPAIDLDGAVVAITGGARGIGRATAELFAARGSTVCIGDLDASAAADTAGAIRPIAYPYASTSTRGSRSRRSSTPSWSGSAASTSWSTTPV